MVKNLQQLTHFRVLSKAFFLGVKVVTCNSEIFLSTNQQIVGYNVRKYSFFIKYIYGTLCYLRYNFNIVILSDVFLMIRVQIVCVMVI